MRHPYYVTPRQEQAEAFREEIAALIAAKHTTPRQGVRVRHDGTVENYIVEG